MTKLVGIATPVRNGARWIGEMLESVRAQTYKEWQLVVVDDGSDDDSLAIAQAHAAADSRIRAVAGPGRGSGAPTCRAFGRNLVSTAARYLYFPDADDVLEPTLVERLVERLDADSGAGAAFCRYLRIDDAGRTIDEPAPPRIAMTKRWVRTLRDDEPFTPFESIYGWAAPAMEPVTMFRVDAFDQAGGWNWPVQGGESIDLLCSIALSHSVLFDPRPLYRYRRHSAQHSADRERQRTAAENLRAAWRARASDDGSIGGVVAAAEFFVDHRLASYWGLKSARRRLFTGDVSGSARFFVGAVRRYRWRFPAT